MTMLLLRAAVMIALGSPGFPPGGVTHSYRYDPAGNRVSTTYGTGRTVTTRYDALNRPETIAEGGRLTRYGYDLAGRAVLLIAGNGEVSENEYDLAGRLVSRALYRSLAERTEGGKLAEFGWSHDALGNVTAQHETWPGEPRRRWAQDHDDLRRSQPAVVGADQRTRRGYGVRQILKTLLHLMVLVR